jgi:serine acetyltransferase
VPVRSVTRHGRGLAGWIVRRGWAVVCRLGEVRAGDPGARRYGAFGTGSVVGFPPGGGFGERWISIGAGTLVAPLVTLSAGMAPGQQMVTDPVVRIGDRCLIGRGSTIVGHYSISVEDDVFMGMGVYITDQNHGYRDVTVAIGRQVPPPERPVRIGAGSWLGTGVVVLPGSDIGRHVVVAANSVVAGPVPDRTVVAGAPARVVRRWDAALGWVAEPDPTAQDPASASRRSTSTP